MEERESELEGICSELEGICSDVGWRRGRFDPLRLAVQEEEGEEEARVLPARTRA